MYDRAVRALSPPAGCTGPCVGPGSYRVGLERRRKADGYAPFLSLTSRGLTFTAQNTDDTAPGPGHYNTTRTQRAVDSIKICREVGVPSIPSPCQAFGYEEAEDGTLRKQYPPQRDLTLGPAYYQPLLDVTYSTVKYKGIRFGNLSGKRCEFKPPEGPGPGQYDITQEAALRYENVNIKKEDKKRYELFIPRYHEVIELQEEKKGFPGPGQYEIESQFQKSKNTVQKGKKILYAPFLSQSKRFLPMRSITPAPGTYNDPHTALESLNKTSGMKRIPFGQTAVRFTQDSRLEKTPGLQLIQILLISRLHNLILNFQVKKSTTKPHKKQKPLFYYLTREKRPAVAMEVPPPGSYEVQKSYEKTYGKSHYMSPRTTLAKRKQGSFLSAAPRDSLLMTDKDIPGPGTYNPVTNSASHVSPCISKVERFKERKENTPGPGAYQDLIQH
ncbi:sperm-tail PG-rich repeat-containing protein 2 isoform X2 [Struthio camelus]|uniref:sperm-tail PG-rich repeat-containing protein 2 isoform X2 n=1 Tax=Struthio camelus TaxID=8801 RepID=UPI003603EFEF